MNSNKKWYENGEFHRAGGPAKAHKMPSVTNCSFPILDEILKDVREKGPPAKIVRKNQD